MDMCSSVNGPVKCLYSYVADYNELRLVDRLTSSYFDSCSHPSYVKYARYGLDSIYGITQQAGSRVSAEKISCVYFHDSEPVVRMYGISIPADELLFYIKENLDELGEYRGIFLSSIPLLESVNLDIRYKMVSGSMPDSDDVEDCFQNMEADGVERLVVLHTIKHGLKEISVDWCQMVSEIKDFIYSYGGRSVIAINRDIARNAGLGGIAVDNALSTDIKSGILAQGEECVFI